MPQPYLPTFKHKRYQIGFELLNERPQFAELIGRCIALWSYVDNELGGLFGILLRTDSDAAQRVFLVLRRWFNQRQALDAAAEGVLVGDERLLFRALMVEYGSLESQRNDLCHGCFGICPDDETLLFMIKIEHHVVWQADILPKHLRGDIPPDSHQGLKEHLYVYQRDELRNLHAFMRRLWWDMFYFNGYLRKPNDSGQVEEFQRTLASPHIQARIAALR